MWKCSKNITKAYDQKNRSISNFSRQLLKMHHNFQFTERAIAGEILFTVEIDALDGICIALSSLVVAIVPESRASASLSSTFAIVDVVDVFLISLDETYIFVKCFFNSSSRLSDSVSVIVSVIISLLRSDSGITSKMLIL